MPTWADVVRIGKRLPEVEESTWFRSPALKVHGKALCRLRTSPDALVVRVIDVEDQLALTRGEPDTFFITPHYDGWPYVLVNLDTVTTGQLEELLEDAWLTMAPKRLVKARS